MLTTATVSRLFSAFNDLNVMIIGDVMVDSYLWGTVERISPEAPVPIVSVEKRENRMGGAANVARNVKSLGANAVLCSVIGHDTKGNEFLNMLAGENMSDEGIVRSDERLTTTKFRIFGNHAQMLRVDEETTGDLNDEEFNQLYEKISVLLNNNKTGVIIFQDYDKGIISPWLINKVVTLAGQKGIPVVVDPKKKNFLEYKNVTLFKPNLKEIKEGLNMEMREDDLENVEHAAAHLMKLIDADIILITLSSKGIYVKWADGSQQLTAHMRNISDVSGAGDTVISVAALCLASGIEPADMAAIANVAGGLVCEEVGVAPIDKNKLQDETIRLLTH
ncbi:MAG TPA: D-glycero-beta-D-manno-heptose-7-phosphate kinase [Bacteroidetes bacterium]|nr:D-glycero-beta-D-manno-heptose-7-phosphate kinase [Bacteroidota bacterium]